MSMKLETLDIPFAVQLAGVGVLDEETGFKTGKYQFSSGNLGGITGEIYAREADDIRKAIYLACQDALEPIPFPSQSDIVTPELSGEQFLATIRIRGGDIKLESAAVVRPILRQVLVQQLKLEFSRKASGIVIEASGATQERNQRVHHVIRAAADCLIVQEGDVVIINQKSAHHPLGYSVTPLMDQEMRQYALFHEDDVSAIVCKTPEEEREMLRKHTETIAVSMEEWYQLAHGASTAPHRLKGAAAMRNDTARLTGHIGTVEGE